MTPQGAGVLKNAGSCHVTLQGLQLYPTLSGETEFLTQIPEVYIPHHPRGNITPRDRSFEADVFLGRDKPKAADIQHFSPSHRGGHKYTVSFTRTQLTANK
jgi:hypothetical protein